MGKTKIEWCDETINFITGCRGNCPYCYARGTAARNARMGSERYVAVARATGNAFTPSFHQKVMDAEHARLARATRSRVVFIGSMSDPATEGDWVYFDEQGNEAGTRSDETIQAQIAHFAEQLPNHTFIILTKRPSNLRLNWPGNLWVGTSVCDHSGAAYRIPYLMSYTQISVPTGDPAVNSPVLQAGGLFASIEPLQGGPDPGDYVDPSWFNGVTTAPGWIIIGSQTRPALPDSQKGCVVENARDLVEWARQHEVPCFIKDNLEQLAPHYRWPREFPSAFGKDNR